MLRIILSSPYFIAQLLLVAAYLPIRHYFLNKTPLNTIEIFNQTRENSVILLLTLVAVYRYKRYYSPEHFLSSLFMFAKTAILLLIYLGNNYIILIYYFLACLFVWLTIRPSAYSGPSRLQELSAEDYERLMTNPQNAANDSFIFMLFYADFSETCFYVG